MARPSRDDAKYRDQVEQALFDLSSTLDLQDEVKLRIQQARRCHPSTSEVLDPAADRLDEAGTHVRRARGILGWLWDLTHREESYEST